MTSIKANVAYSTLYNLLVVAVPFVTAPYLSRVLGPEGIGVQSYTLSVVTYFTIFAALGVSSYGSRAMARLRDDKGELSRSFWEIFFMVVLSSVVSLAGWGVFLLFASEYRTIYMILTFNVIAVMLDVSWLFRGLEEFKLISLRNTVVKICSVAAIFLFVRGPEDVVVYVLINTLSTFLGAVAMWPYLRSRVSRVPMSELRILRHFRELMVYFLPTVATSIYLILDKTLIGIFTTDAAQNGYYAQADNVVNIAKTLVFASVNSVMGMRVSYLFKQEKYSEIKELTARSMNFILCLGSGIMWGIAAVAPTFVPFFFGEGYDEVVPLLYIFAPVIVVVGISNCIGSNYYTPSGRRMQSTRYLIAGAVVNLMMNLALIPRFGARGAAIATLVAEMFITLLYVGNSNGYMPWRLVAGIGAKKILAGAIMFGVVVLVSFADIAPLWLFVAQVILGVAVYAIMLIILKDEWSLMMLRSYVKPIIERFYDKRAK